jgi:hypothetical protein
MGGEKRNFVVEQARNAVNKLAQRTFTRKRCWFKMLGCMFALVEKRGSAASAKTPA